MIPTRPANTAPDMEWIDWIYDLEAMTRVEEFGDMPDDIPQEESTVPPAIEQALAEGYALLKQRAIQAADAVLHFTDDEMQAVQAITDQFYEGIWYYESGELYMAVEWNKRSIPGQCISLIITRDDEQVLTQSACISPMPLKGEERSPYSTPIPIPRFNQPDFSRQYSLFPEMDS